ncbi:glycosyltransferase family 39 protein [Actinoallomurus purpureus]|uniref:glycosyltransferase family 39 protein n=1 Tax=Actinoallomurus purpureus TaxID=478114 RepID=UPI0025B23F1D|nr:glycosyltransferase family 39 protein [Actinoallomurus purpureus]
MTTQLSEPTGVPQAPPASRLRRLALGPADDPRWARPALWVILALATALYAWGLSEGGDANSFYSAAVKSGTQSWKAFFFGSLDSASFITVDKPPMALWVQEIFGRVIGFGTWSLLLPEVIMGVAAVAVVYATVRRAFGPVAGVIAALVMTLTPITVAINRDNNPDTLLVLLLALSAWACQRALESGRLRWLLASAFFIGCGFNTKMLQAFILLPALALVYLLFAQGGWLRRIGHLLAAGVVLAVSSFWWMMIVDLIPASKRPYIGGSTDGTAWDLIIGYNGIGRITGSEGGGPGGGRAPSGGGRGGPGGGGGGGGFSGQSGIGRMFNDVLGGQISWLLPLAALVLVAGMILYWKRPRTDLARAALVMWGGWLAVHFVVFSFASGIMHPYYTTAMAPAIAALAGIGAVELGRAYRRGGAWTWVLPAGIAVTGVWAFVLLRRTPSWNPWLAWTVAGLTAVAVIGLLAARFGRGALTRIAVLAGVVGLVAGLAGPAAFAVSAAGDRANGSNPTAGPNTGGMGFPGMRGGGMPGGGQLPADIRKRIEEGGGFPGGGFPGGGAPGGSGDPGGAGQMPGGQPGGQNGRQGGPGMGGELNAQMVSYLEKNQGGATWLVAVSNSQSAASIILQTGKPAISMFGFAGGDRAMTAQRLQELVKAGKLHYVMTGGGFGGRGGPGGGNSDVTSWVTKNCAAVKPSEYGGSSSTGSSQQSDQGSGSSLYRCG